MKHVPIPIACTIPLTEVGNRTVERHDLFAQARSTKRIDSGVIVSFAPSFAGDVAALVEKEAECCAFLSMETEIATDELLLSVTTQDESALPAIEAFVGLEPHP